MYKRQSKNDGLSIEDALLRTGRNVDQQTLDKAIKLAVSSKHQNMTRRCGHVSIARASGKHPYRIVATPLPAGVMFSLQPVMAMLFIIDPDERIFCDSLTLVETLGLTEREAEIAVKLANGEDISTIAIDIGVSVMTARKHLQNIYKKAEVGRQGELVSLICNLAVTAPREPLLTRTSGLH